MRHWLTVAFLLFGLGMLPGCIILPTTEACCHSGWWDGIVGSSESTAPIKVSQSDHEDVERVLGKPVFRSQPPGDYWQYCRREPTWIVIFFFPVSHGKPVHNVHELQETLDIRFEKNGRVTGYSIERTAF
jgi:hypothetical protein